MGDKGNQPQKQKGALERFQLGEIKKLIVPIFSKVEKSIKKEKKNKRGLYKDHGRLGIYQSRWLHHNEMIMHHKRIKRRRRRNEIAKQSRHRNRITA